MIHYIYRRCVNQNGIMHGKFAELHKMDFTRLLYIASELHFWWSVLSFTLASLPKLALVKKHLGLMSEKSSVIFSFSSSKYSVSFLSVHIALFETWLFLFFRNSLMTFYKSLLTLKFGIFYTFLNQGCTLTSLFFILSFAGNAQILCHNLIRF